MASYADGLRARMKPTHASALKAEKVDVPIWGECYVKQLTVAEVDEQAKEIANSGDKQSFAKAAARVIVDPDGKRVFDPNKQEDIDFLAGQPWELLHKLVEASNRFNAQSAAGVEEQKKG
jgi:hypothetical protein